MKLPETGSTVKIKAADQEYEGVLLESETDCVCVKMGSGYNVGIKQDSIESVEVLEKPVALAKEAKVKQNDKLPAIHILHTGGTIASKVDYSTGAVVSRTSPDEILSSIPELLELANITTKTVFQMFSEDLEPVHWTLLSQEIANSIKAGAKGVIVGIGTDTLEYAASAMAFALRNCPIPVLFVGSQRSSDRPSSDASMNLLCAAQYMINSEFKGVGVCLHDKMDDDKCLIVPAHHVKKMHTSRRDTFRPVNQRPIARVNMKGEVEEVSKFVDGEGEFELKEKFSNNVALVKVYPGFRAEELENYSRYDGLVVEGYAFGQLPINEHDEHTKHHPKLLEQVKKLASKIPVLVVSQRPYGVVHMTVYSTSRHLLEAGVVEGKMQSHVAYVKMCHVLANYPVADVKKILSENLTGEVVERSEEDTFLI